MMLTFRQMPNGEQKPDDVEQIEPCSALALLQNSDGQRLMKSNSRYQASHVIISFLKSTIHPLLPSGRTQLYKTPRISSRVSAPQAYGNFHQGR